LSAIDSSPAGEIKYNQQYSKGQPVELETAWAQLPLQRQSLPQAIYLAVREAILGGRFRPGEALRQESLAKEFDASRVPVREALNRLEAEGLVVLRPRRGFVVASLDLDEVIEIFQLRMVLEEHAGFVATERRTRTDVAEVGKILDHLEKIKIDKAANVAKWAAYNRQFHARLFESSRRGHLCGVTNMLRDKVERYVRVEVAMTGHLDRAQAEHRKIFKAFSDGDAARVGKLSREHCESTADRLIAALKAREAAASSE
jgi:DNA-binding GntR family transcriptional regulator